MFLLLMISSITLFVKAQQVNTLYFMEDVPVRHFLNPSFQPTTDFYLSLPVIGFTQFGVGNNSLTLKDIIFNENGKTVSFLNSLSNEQRFYNTLKPTTVIHTDLQTNLLSFGFRHESAYWTFSVTEKADGTIKLSKDLFQLSLFGTTNPQNNSFDITNLDGKLSVYTEAAVGYSKRVNDKWLIGGKLKLLLGTANVLNTNNQLILNAGAEKWILSGTGTANYSGPVQLNIGPNYQSFSYTTPSGLPGWLKPSGMGAGIDAGFEYRFNKKIKLSAAIKDFGFIRWSKNVQNNPYRVNYSFDGVKSFDNSSTVNTYRDVYNKLILKNYLVDSIVAAFKTSSSSSHTSNSYTSTTTAKINLGFEYNLLKDKLSFGLLSYSQLFRNVIAEELTASVNAKPNKWLNATLSYSLFNGGLSTIGAGLGIKTGIFHWFLAADYIPFQKATLSLSEMGVSNSNIKIPIPYNSTSFNLALGLNIVFDKKIHMKKGLLRNNKKQDCNCEWN